MKSLLDAVNTIRRKEPVPIDDTVLTFEEDKMEQKLDISVRDLILISSEGNYVQLYYMLNDKLTKKLIRKTLKDTRQYLSPYNSFFQCHRSHIVNIDKIVSYKGNAKGFRASLKHLEFKVPISRVYIDIFKERLVQNKQT
jgi:DNA-binding LytR/AlgR family response regulator